MTILGIDGDKLFEQDNKTLADADNDSRQFWDDLSGRQLNADLVKKAREEEMREVRKHNV